MKWRDALQKYHPDTLIIIEIAERFLQDYFGHGADRAEEVLSEFFSRFGGSFDEEYVRDEHSWRLANAAHYCIQLQGERVDLPEWRRREGYLRTPPEALEYLREHYWNRNR
jgi:anaerobic selenocysteine-containing dehydrogenase